MSDFIEKEVKDLYFEHSQHNTFTEGCSECFKENQIINSEPKVCEFCDGKGYITKTEWVGTDTSYDVELKCVCQEE